MNWYRSEEEVDKLIESMLTKGKSKHITQSVVFNKNNPRQMRLLKMILMSSESFSGYMKNIITQQFNEIKLPSEMENEELKSNVINSNEIKEGMNSFEVEDEIYKEDENTFEEIKTPLKKSVGNFI